MCGRAFIATLRCAPPSLHNSARRAREPAHDMSHDRVHQLLLVVALPTRPSTPAGSPAESPPSVMTYKCSCCRCDCHTQHGFAVLLKGPCSRTVFHRHISSGQLALDLASWHLVPTASCAVRTAVVIQAAPDDGPAAWRPPASSCRPPVALAGIPLSVNDMPGGTWQCTRSCKTVCVWLAFTPRLPSASRTAALSSVRQDLPSLCAPPAAPLCHCLRRRPHAHRASLTAEGLQNWRRRLVRLTTLVDGARRLRTCRPRRSRRHPTTVDGARGTPRSPGRPPSGGAIVHREAIVVEGDRVLSRWLGYCMPCETSPLRDDQPQ